MRGSVAMVVFVSVLCAASATPVVKRNALRQVVAEVDPKESCVNNATHCTCIDSTYRRLIPIEGSYPKKCTIDPVEIESNKCACPGTSLCEREIFPCSKTQAVGEVDTSGEVVCTEIQDASCKKVMKPEPCSHHVNVFVNGEKAGCVNNVPVSSNVDEAYGYGDAKAQNIENVEYDRINLRLIETTMNNELHLCVIYGNWKVGEVELPNDPELSRKEKSKITADFPLFIEIKDDPNDFYSGDGTTEILTQHAHYAHKSDGYCLGPLLGDGSGIRAEFYDLDNIFGLNVQTYSKDTLSIENLAKWSFADYLPASALQADGRSDGDESVVVDFKPTCSC
mmetsp:Transcript_1645/g.3494  ORF Transcript_1645/g.3494 Transcript_1645/m.3494 type:complete len:337 (-) Transcript_1645:14-1024(-)